MDARKSRTEYNNSWVLQMKIIIGLFPSLNKGTVLPKIFIYSWLDQQILLHVNAGMGHPN